MKRKLSTAILVLLALALITSACSGRSTMTASGWAGLAVEDETAYVAFGSHVVAVNLTNGTERWRYPAEADAKISFYAVPGLTEDGNLIVGGYDNVLYIINTENGQGYPLFEGASGRYIGGPLVTPNLIYAPSSDHALYAVGLNGQPVWQFESGGPIWAKPVSDANCECVYLSSMDHSVYALDSQSGSQVWKTEDLGGAIVGTPTISDDNILYVGTFNNELVAIDVKTGRELWRFTANDWIWEGPALDDDILYFGDLSGSFYAVNRLNGVSKWQIQPGGAIVGTPLVTEEDIYFTTEDGSIVSVNKSGAIRWNQPSEASYHAGPVVAGDSILITTSDPENLLIAYDQSGVQKWSFGLAQ